MDLLIEKKNSKKILFTPGPASLSKANLINLNPAFGRGDKSYQNTEIHLNILLFLLDVLHLRQT